MKDNYEIIFNNLNIIENQKEYDIQTGGYDELKHNQIIELWQNPDFNSKFLNFYVIVNKYLRGLELEIKPEWLSILKLHSKTDFTEFMIYYVNRLTTIIYKNLSTTKRIFYRGENRKNFYQGIGDVLFYSTFQSVSSSLSVAYKFAESHEKVIKILFVMEIPEKNHYKELTTKLKLYNYKKKITTIIDEKEYLIMPNSYYVIVDKFNIYNDITIVKLKLIKQDYFQIKNNELYEQQTIIPKQKDYKNFNSSELNNFIKLSQIYKKMIDKLNSLNLYKIDITFYQEIYDSNNNNLFNLDMELINNIVSQIDDLNIRKKAEEIKNIGLGYYNNQIKKITEYKKHIDRINLIVKTDFNSIKYLEVYAGYYNINTAFKIPEFIEFLKKQKFNQEFEYSKILITNLESNKFLYNDIYNADYPRKKLKNNNNTKQIYYKYLIKFELFNTKICVCSEHFYENDNNVILIPNFKMKITEIKDLYNKFELPYILYKISVF
jgi:hypothetical protein